MIFQTLLKKRSLILTVVSLLVSAVFLCLLIFKNQQIIFKQFDSKLSTSKFEHSQWRVPNSKTPISDEDLYAYSGFRYINGENPILVSPEVPPFGKYLIGVSILFGSQFYASLIMAVGSLVLIFFITKKITNSVTSGSLAVLFTSINTLFFDQILHAPQLDIFQLFFLLLLLLLLMLYSESNSKLLLIAAGTVFGLFLSIKVFILSFFLINGWLLLYYIFIFKKYPLKKAAVNFVILNAFALITFTLTYFRYFQYGNSLHQFLGVQKYIYTFYSQSHIDMTKLIGNYLFLIFFNHWRFWSEGYPVVQYENWSFIWPITFVVGIISMIVLFREKIKNHAAVLLLIALVIIYNLFLLAVPIFPRYLLILFVPMDILISIYLAKLLKV